MTIYYPLTHSFLALTKYGIKALNSEVGHKRGTKIPLFSQNLHGSQYQKKK
jgi:hypothetical protein